MSAAPEILEYRFQDVSEAVNFAFAMEAKQLRPSIPIEEMAKYGEIMDACTNPAEISMQDKIAEGSMLRQLIWRTVRAESRRALSARHTICADEQLSRRHEQDVQALSDWVFSRHKQIQAAYEESSEYRRARLKFFLVDMARGWAGEKPHNELKEWAAILKRPYSTVYTWGRSLRPEDRSAYWWMGSWYDHALLVLANEFHVRELIP